MIVTKITSRKEADKAINQYGENQKKIKELEELSASAFPSPNPKRISS